MPHHITHNHAYLPFIIGKFDDIKIIASRFIAVEAYAVAVIPSAEKLLLGQEILLDFPGYIDCLLHGKPVLKLPGHFIKTFGQFSDFIPARHGKWRTEFSFGQIIGCSGNFLYPCCYRVCRLSDKKKNEKNTTEPA